MTAGHGGAADAPTAAADATPAALARVSTAARAGTADWFTVADMVGASLVPARCHWCVVHVRADVLAAIRTGERTPDLLPRRPSMGGELEMVTLRHHASDGEVQLRDFVRRFPPRVGDAYGAGRVALTGLTRHAPHVDAAGVAGIVDSPQEATALQDLDLASTIVVPLCTDDGLLLGTLAMGNFRGGGAALTAVDLRHVEALAAVITSAFVFSWPTTITGTHPCSRTPHDSVWRPADATDVTNAAAARTWLRQALPDILDVVPDEAFYDDMDLVVSELVGNAVRHGGGLVAVQLTTTSDGLRVCVSDDDPRAPIVRTGTDAFRVGGRGMQVVTAIVDEWGVERSYDTRGKTIWCDLTPRPRVN